ncbi:MAG: hypothetical protein GY795_46415, partial [Desulfobacterales bacterium]|nr:hypothetical protein [Desulfobacterales bacterium]
IVTAGKRKSDENMVFTAEIEGLEGVTFSSCGTRDSLFPDGYWPGVDMETIMGNRRLTEPSTSEYGITVPKKKELQISVYMKSSLKTQAFDITDNGAYYNSVQFTGHAAESWSDTVLWYAQDENGYDAASLVQTPEKISSLNDTNLIMLWGGSSSNPYSETVKSGSIGAIVGFVDEYYSLLAMPYDSVSKEMQDDLENGGDIGNLSEDEIFGPVALADVTKVARRGFHSITAGGAGIKFSLNIGESKHASLIIYDLKGRIIMKFSYDDLISKTELFWNGSSMTGGQIGNGMYIARLTMDGYRKSLKFTR